MSKDLITGILKKGAGVFYNCKYSIEKKCSTIHGSYGSLRFVAAYNIKSFKKVKLLIDQKNVERIKLKRKVNIGFVTYTSSMWNVDELFNNLLKDNRFDASIVLVHLIMSDKDSSDKEYKKTKKYFNDLHYKIVEADSIHKNQEFDILFYLTPYAFDIEEQCFNIKNVPLSTILLHTSYSYMLAGNMQKLDLWTYHWTLSYYTDSVYYKKLIEKSKYYTGNTKYLGFPKMDRFYSVDVLCPSNKKIIIYAPHHSVNYKEFKSATFEDNYLAILELAKKYTKDTYWIYKPHPLLRANSVSGGIFESVEDYDSYEQEWASLPNAEVITSGDYYPIFKGSAAMITDSVSFLAEYQFTGNPLLLLESGKERYNEFGNAIISVLYKCKGDSLTEIEAFVKNVINNIDVMKEERKSFFEKNLFYMQDGVTANNRIYDDISELVGEEMQEGANY